MTDVRLVATNPDDGVLIPVASNASGQLAVQSPKIEKIPNDVEVEGTVTATGFIGPGMGFDGNLAGNLTVSGTGEFVNGNISLYDPGSTDAGAITFSTNSGGTLRSKFQGTTAETSIYSYNNSPIKLYVGGNADNVTLTLTSDNFAIFDSEVIISSRGNKWLIRESNGVAMLIDQTLTKQATEKVRDLPRELDLIEAALSEIMDKLKMTPPAGWEVWDGSDNSQ